MAGGWVSIEDAPAMSTYTMMQAALSICVAE